MQLQLLSNKVHLQLIDVMCFNWMWSKQYFNRDICQKVFYVCFEKKLFIFRIFWFSLQAKAVQLSGSVMKRKEILRPVDIT